MEELQAFLKGEDQQQGELDRNLHIHADYVFNAILPALFYFYSRYWDKKEPRPLDIMADEERVAKSGLVGTAIIALVGCPQVPELIRRVDARNAHSEMQFLCEFLSTHAGVFMTKEGPGLVQPTWEVSLVASIS